RGRGARTPSRSGGTSRSRGGSPTGTRGGGKPTQRQARLVRYPAATGRERPKWGRQQRRDRRHRTPAVERLGPGGGPGDLLAGGIGRPDGVRVSAGTGAGLSGQPPRDSTRKSSVGWSCSLSKAGSMWSAPGSTT